MKQYVLNMSMDKFIHQNDAYIVDIADGSLIDNYLLYNDKYVFGVFEEYVNCWTSQHVVCIAGLTTKEAADIESRFYRLAERMETA